MISRILAGVLLIASFCGVIYWQHSRIATLKTQAIIKDGTINALRETRKGDQKRVDNAMAEVARQRADRNKLAGQLEKNADETRRFFAMPIPDGVRSAINEYLGRYKAPGNQK